MLKQIRYTILSLAGCGLACLSLDSASAQFSMGGSSMGGTSSMGGMSGSTGTSAFGSRTLGGGTSSNRTGRSTGASNPLTGQSGQQGVGTGAPTGERYLRGNQGRFVGADSSDGALNSYSQQAMGGMNGGLGNMMGNQMMMQAFRQSQQQNQQGKNQQNKLAVRTPFRVDSMAQPALTTTFTSRMQTRFANLPALKGRASIEPVLQGDTLVLRGSVESAAERQLVEDLLSLEPGVGPVRNELAIVQREPAIPVSIPASVEPSAPKRESRPLER